VSLRLRLTLLYTAILVLTLIAFSFALHVNLARSNLRVLDDQLADEADRIIGASGFKLDRLVVPISRFAAAGTFLQGRAADGSIEFRTENLGRFSLPLTDEGLRVVQRGEAWLETTSIQNVRLRVYTTPVSIGGQVIGMVQVGRTLTDLDQALTALRGILIIGICLATLVAFGIGWMLAGAALRPINRITQTAQAIGSERDFGRRVAYSGPHDEVGELATTFNTMLTELQGAYRQVEQALQAQRRFVADASHELRTPLTTVRGNIALLQRVPPIEPEDRDASLADMRDETDRLIRLVNDLLVLARADTGRPWNNEAIPLEPIMEEVCRTARLLAPGRNLRCATPEGATVIADRDALKQVLLILLDNAIKFTPDDGVISLESDMAADCAVLRVRDTGIGMPPEMLPQIFERFYRGEASRTGVGAGLGLAIARTLVEAQHGTIAVESTPGQGSVFTITLPLAEQAESPAADVSASTPLSVP
jgi:two-component system, OmpR family, sensor kinase